MDSLVGFRFLPTNEEIIHLLKKKRSDPDFSVHTVKEINIYSFEPWELPWHSEIQSAEQVWYFFSEPYYKFAKSKRAHRRTSAGYWKITSTVSGVKAKNSPDVIASKRILSFYILTPASKAAKTEWSMHEFYVEDDDPLYKKDFVVCRIERKRENKLRISTRDEDQSSQTMVSSSTIHVAEHILPEIELPSSQHLVSNRNQVVENIILKSQPPPCDLLISDSGNHVTVNSFVDPQLLSMDPLISYFGNHVAENVSSKSQLLPNHNLISHPKNHVAENASPKAQAQLLPNHVAENTYPKSRLLPNHNLVSHSRNPVAENTFAESQQAPNHNVISYKIDVAENDNPESQLRPNQNLELEQLPKHALEITFQAEPPLLTELYALDGYNRLNDASFSRLWSQDYPELEFSYSNGSSNRHIQTEYSSEESGQTHTPDFNSSKSDGGIYVEDSTCSNTETLNAWVNELFVDSSLC